MNRKFDGQVSLDHYFVERHKCDLLTTRDKVEYILQEFPRTQFDTPLFLSLCESEFALTHDYRQGLLTMRELLLHAWKKQSMVKKHGRTTTKNRA